MSRPRRHHALPAYRHRRLGRPLVLGAREVPRREPGIIGPATAAGRGPVGFTTFPGEIWAAPRSWVEAVYPGLAYFNEVDKGGHFAAWEEPAPFSKEVRAIISFAALGELPAAAVRGWAPGGPHLATGPRVRSLAAVR